MGISPKLGGYSITSSARARIDGGNVRPIAAAAFILIASTNLVGCSNGQIARAFALEDLVHISRGPSDHVHRVRPIRHQPTCLHDQMALRRGGPRSLRMIVSRTTIATDQSLQVTYSLRGIVCPDAFESISPPVRPFAEEIRQV